MRARLTLLVISALVMSACTGGGQHSAPRSAPPAPTSASSRRGSASASQTPLAKAQQLARERGVAEGDRCFGAAALAAPKGRCARMTRSGTLTPSPLEAGKDRSDAYRSVSGGKGCFAYPPNFPLTTCTFGDPNSTTAVALIGNSHAAQWVPAIKRIAVQERWRVTTYLASQCALADVPQHFDTPASTQACLDWGHQVTERVAGGKFHLVLMTNKVSRGVPGHDLTSSRILFEGGYERVLRPLKKAHLRVVGIRDTPSPGFQVPDCLAAHPDDYGACNGTRATWLPPEPLTPAMAAMHDKRMTVVDMTTYICDGNACPAAVGGVPVYFDVSHLTATYAKTLTPYLADAIKAALDR